MRQNEDYPIDIVITWVDPTDPSWIEERNRYVPQSDRRQKSTGGDERFDDNGLLRYLFRGIDQFAPWVNKIHFVTCGHLPPWLNTEHPKLHIVKHSDFIRPEFLPTFNAHPLGLNLHNIPGLAEHFIYVNDDMYFVSPTPKESFFRKGLPCDMASLDTIECASFQDAYYYSLVNDFALLNRLVRKRAVLKKHPFQWLNPKYGLRHNLRTLCLWPMALFTNIYEPHTPAPYLKSTFSQVANLLREELSSVCRNRVRSPYDCTENVVRFFQMCTGNFVPTNRDSLGRYCTMKQKGLPDLIRSGTYQLLCINYSDSTAFAEVRNAFDSILPHFSSFEKDNTETSANKSITREQ